MKVETATAPSHWAPYLINGDTSGLSEYDRGSADDWIARLKMGAPVSCEDAGFIWMHDAHREEPSGGDCQTFTFLIPEDSQ